MERDPRYYRVVIAKRLKEFLSGKVSREEVYKWALSQVVLTGYEEISQKDPLIKESLQALIAVNHEDAQDKPTVADFKYYIQCLDDIVEFEPKEQRRQKKDVKKKVKKSNYRKDAKIASRVYVVLFAVCSLAVNIFSVFRPDFFTLGIWSPPKIKVFIDSFPHIVYAVLLLISPSFLVKRNTYFIYLTVFAVACAYYWFVALSFIIKFSLHPLVIFILAPYSGMPTLLAVMLLIEERKKFRIISQM